MKKVHGLVFILWSLLLTGCGAHVGAIKYDQPLGVDVQNIAMDEPIQVAIFKDSRNDYPEVERMIGRLSGGFGETLKSIEIPQPVALATSDTVCDFLKSVGVNATRVDTAGQSDLVLSGNITHFYCLFLFMHNATINIDLVLTDTASGEKLWEGSIKGHHGGNLFSKYPKLTDDPTIGCMGYDCHAKGVNAAMNLMFSEGIADVWKNGGLRDALDKEHR